MVLNGTIFGAICGSVPIFFANRSILGTSLFNGLFNATQLVLPSSLGVMLAFIFSPTSITFLSVIIASTTATSIAAILFLKPNFLSTSLWPWTDKEADIFRKSNLETSVSLAESRSFEALQTSKEALKQAKKVELSKEEIQKLFSEAIGGSQEDLVRSFAYQGAEGREGPEARKRLLIRLEDRRQMARNRALAFLFMALFLGVASAYIIYNILFPCGLNCKIDEAAAPENWGMHDGIDSIRQILAFSVLNIFVFFFFTSSARAFAEVSSTSQEIVTINLWLFAYGHATTQGRTELQDEALRRIISADRNPPVIDKSKTSLELAKAQSESDLAKQYLDRVLEIMPRPTNSSEH